MGDQSGRIIKGGHGALSDAGVQDLVSPGEQGNGSTSVSGPVTESGHTTASLVGQELEIVQSTTALGEARQRRGPTGLLLEDVLEVNVAVGKGHILLGKLLEAEDDVLLGGLLPRSGGDQLCADGGELFVIVDALGGSFDADGVAGIKESLGCRGRH